MQPNGIRCADTLTCKALGQKPFAATLTGSHTTCPLCPDQGAARRHFAFSSPRASPDACPSALRTTPRHGEPSNVVPSSRDGSNSQQGQARGEEEEHTSPSFSPLESLAPRHDGRTERCCDDASPTPPRHAVVSTQSSSTPKATNVGLIPTSPSPRRPPSSSQTQTSFHINRSPWQ